MSKRIYKRIYEVSEVLKILTSEFTFGKHSSAPFPSSVVTELLYSVRFQISAYYLNLTFMCLVRAGYEPFSFPKNSKEYIMVKNIIKIIDHAQEKRNK